MVQFNFKISGNKLFQEQPVYFIVFHLQNTCIPNIIGCLKVYPWLSQVRKSGYLWTGYYLFIYKIFKGNAGWTVYHCTSRIAGFFSSIVNSILSTYCFNLKLTSCCSFNDFINCRIQNNKNITTYLLN
jgi:hypothetical protein